MALSAPPGAIHLNASDGRRVGTTLATARPGYSGVGYVTGFRKDGDALLFTLPQARPGIYDVHIRYSAPTGPKGYSLVVNGEAYAGMFAATGDAFAAQDAGKIELQPGPNALAIEKGWGYYDIDALDLVPSPPPPALKPLPPAPVDPQATPQVRALLVSLGRQYGAKTLSGQYDMGDTDYIRAVTGRTPAIRGGDLMDYSPSRLAHGADPHHEAEALIAAARAGQIVTVSWHWNAPAHLRDTPAQPWYKGFYTDASTFDLQRALADPHSDDYALLLRDMDAITVQLKKFQDAGVPVLWRPLHEAGGGWFWWGAKGPRPFVQLWRLLHDRLTQYHHLHNLLWVYTDSADPAWYPGDAYVDIVGADAYPGNQSDPLSSTWQDMARRYDGKKLLALTEFGGVPDVARMRRFGVRWSYFVSWTGDLGPRKLSRAALVRLYHAPAVVTQASPTP